MCVFAGFWRMERGGPGVWAHVSYMRFDEAGNRAARLPLRVGTHLRQLAEEVQRLHGCEEVFCYTSQAQGRGAEVK